MAIGDNAASATQAALDALTKQVTDLRTQPMAPTPFNIGLPLYESVDAAEAAKSSIFPSLRDYRAVETDGSIRAYDPDLGSDVVIGYLRDFTPPLGTGSSSSITSLANSLPGLINLPNFSSLLGPGPKFPWIWVLAGLAAIGVVMYAAGGKKHRFA